MTSSIDASCLNRSVSEIFSVKVEDRQTDIQAGRRIGSLPYKALRDPFVSRRDGCMHDSVER